MRHRSMALGAGKLVDDLVIPIEAQPPQPVDDRGDRLRCRPLAVGIFDPQVVHATIAILPMVPGEKPVEERRAGAADMQKSRRGGGKANSDTHREDLRQLRMVFHRLFPRSLRGAASAANPEPIFQRPVFMCSGPRTSCDPGMTRCYAIAGSRTVAFEKAGITSVANRSSCSRQADCGTPTDRLTEIRSRPG